jgi:hypothetical protein
MAKKSRRARTAVPAQPISSAAGTPVMQPVRSVRPVQAPTTHVVKDVDFGKEYHYVIKDLKLTFAIAAALLVLMVVLYLIIA